MNKCVCGHEFERHREHELGGEGCFQGSQQATESPFQWDWIICECPRWRPKKQQQPALSGFGG
jgi:hypothetical protein